ncbi:MAG: amidohydrolase family protein, partial [Myxococcota bacterium]
IDADGIAAMARAGTVGVLLPGAMVYLRDVSPPVGALREAGVPLAIATDLNPGTSPIANPWICATLACVTMGVTVAEALRGITVVAARALGRADLGVVRPGAAADLVLRRPLGADPPSAASLIHAMSGARTAAVWSGGARLR